MFVIGSRGSKLALWQANHVAGRLAEFANESRIEIIQTSGDRFQSGPLKEVGNKGLFTKEIEEALLDRRVDIAVHSCKDMPNTLPEGLQIAAVPPREDPRDALVGGRLSDLPAGSRVGTGSLRRTAQLSFARPDLRVEPMRGNVDTRLRKLDDGQFDAIVLAAAGLHRLGWSERIAEYLPFDVMCPAVGQGALVVETRMDDGEAARACAKLNDENAHRCILAERAVLSILGGGCQVPIGAHAVIADSQLHLRAVVISVDGSDVVRHEEHGSAAEADSIGKRCGEALLSKGAREILAGVYGNAG